MLLFIAQANLAFRNNRPLHYNRILELDFNELDSKRGRGQTWANSSWTLTWAKF